MSLVTFFALPKSFEDFDDAIRQQNAILSWLNLPIPVRVILMSGRDKSVQQFAKSYSLDYVDVEVNEYGTPLLSSAFSIADELSDSAYICYINSDIILLPGFSMIFETRLPKRFLAVGKRTDLDFNETINFNDIGWCTLLQCYATKSGVLHSELGIDYFLFPKGQFVNLPPFAVGRPAWDNWMLYQARNRSIPLIDLTETVVAIHQNHDYKHVPLSKGNTWEGPEAEKNRALAGDPDTYFDIADCSWYLKKGILSLKWDDLYFKRRISRIWALRSRKFLALRGKIAWAIYKRRRFFREDFWKNIVWRLTN
jgi:hypothetical protein